MAICPDGDLFARAGSVLAEAQKKTGPGRTPDRSLDLACRLWFLEEEPGSKQCRCAVFGGAVKAGVLTPVDFPAHAHLLDRLPHDVGRDLVQLVLTCRRWLQACGRCTAQEVLLFQSIDVTELCVEGRGFGQAERQTNGEGDCFKRITIDVDMASRLRTRTCWSADLHRSQRQRSG
jgi:hypothetical protein